MRRRRSEQGAAAAVIDDPAVTDGMSAAEKANYFVVPDTLKALQELAARHRRQLGIPISRLRAATENDDQRTDQPDAETEIPRSGHAGNFNNHIGVPRTLLAMDRSAGIRRRGDGCESLRRDRAAVLDRTTRFRLITNIGKAHLEGFGGIEGVMRGKGNCSTTYRRTEERRSIPAKANTSRR